jgi:chemosensory pili system protein ChpA (sensor histidine kinase/response regulator)
MTGSPTDLTALSWCLGEIRESLARAEASLEQQLQSGDEDLARLRAARSWLHQAHGALQVVDLEGVAVVTQEAEGLLDRIERGEMRLDGDVSRAMVRTFAAIVEYLEGVVAGSGDSPVSLFPHYRELLALRASDRVEPADLYAVDLSVRPPKAPLAEPLDSAGIARMRAAFEKGLLGFLRNPEDAAALAEMHAAIDRLHRAHQASSQRTFWWLAAAFFDALRVRALPVDLYAKRLVARINLQIRRTLQQGTPIADRMLRDILFLLARAGGGSALADEARALYRLAGTVPADFETPRYGVVDARALRAAREATGAAKLAWEKAVRGGAQDLPAFATAAQALDAAVARLPWPGLQRLAGVLVGLRRALAAAGPQLAEVLSLEVATALLFVEHALERGARGVAQHDRRATEMAERIDGLCERQESDGSPTPEWLSELSRAAQERLTVAAFVGELQANLRACEKALDTFFRDPSQRAALPELEPLLKQVGGALRLLGHGEAADGADTVVRQIAAFLETEEPPAAADCERVAESLGALGFFVESLLRADRQGGFEFRSGDDAFVARLGEPPVARAEPLPEADAALGVAPFDVSEPIAEPGEARPVPLTPPSREGDGGRSLEQLLAERRIRVRGQLAALQARADDPVARAALHDALVAVRDEAMLLDDAELRAHAGEALARLEAASSPHDAALVEAIARVAGEAEAVALEAIEVPEDEAAIDDELLGIFLDEADEVLAAIDEGRAASVVAPSDVALLTTLRRGFHTLKGSSRMVGLAAFGEAAWGMEQVLNGWLADELPGTPALYAGVAESHDAMSGWVARLRDDPAARIDPSRIVAGTIALRESGAWPEADATSGVVEAAAEPEVIGVVGLAEVIEAPEAIEAIEAVEPVEAVAPDLSAPDADAVEALELELGLPEAGADEAVVSDDIAATAPGTPFDVSPDALAGIETIELDAAGFDVASLDVPSIEAPAPDLVSQDASALDAVAPDTIPLDAPAADTVTLDAPALDAVSPIDLSAIDPELAALEADAEAALVASAALPAGAGDDVIELTELLDPLDPLEVPVLSPLDEIESIAIGEPAGPDALDLVAADTPADDGTVRIGERTLSATLYRIFLDEADQLLAALEAALARWRADPAAPVDEAALRAVHSLGGSTRIVGLAAVHATADALERFMLGRSVSSDPLAPADVDDVAFVLDRVRASLHRFAAGEDPGEDVAMTARAEALAARWSVEVDALAPPDAAPAPDVQVARLPLDAVAPRAEAPAADTLEGLAALVDEIDAELAPVFIEEADELLPRIGEALRAWQQQPDDASGPATLMRLLHTVKGSARMAGAMRLGQLVHDMETRIEAASALPRVPASLVDDLIARYDQVLALYEAVRDPQSEAAQAASRAVIESLSGGRATAQAEHAADGAVPARSQAGTDGQATPAAAAPEKAQQLIRVRADLLDRLVNEAGEVSIARARLDNELGGLRQSLGELTENVNRLRSQLREIELAADSQIQARDARTKEPDTEFDPLEFDRYTRFQELTRMLAESVNDVATVQQNALRNLDEAARDLARQSQVTRDLQQDLMRIRMVQFGSIADRLYRVVRQAAKELDKRVHLDLKGASAELDRGVLERMAGPIEHLLRNAVAHGIEPRADRLAAGKSETGEITLEVRQEGNEVILSFADDGGGLHYGRIRERAIERGLIPADAHPGERELGELIFMPGFSTATSVTAIAGRGVGMDVVRAEVAAMGGRIDLESTPGRGTRFTVHLPVSLAVAQVVLLTVGTVRISVASALIEQVMQLKPEALASAYGQHAVEWHGQPVPLYFLGSLLELPGCTPLAQRYSPVVIVRSGSTRIALHVDHVAPSQEVVVKHVGPQLARLTGMAGATVLGNGDIVLILNPVQIAATGRGAQAGEGDTATFAPTRIEIAPTVMVVDDSVTVRKVTQRLLSREGYQVMLAKDGIDALRQLQDTVPDVMLLDIEMPRMDGFDLTKNLRGDDRWKHLPIVMITSRTADKHRNHAMALGVDVFLGKPYDEAELLGHVKAMAARRQAAT